MYTEQRDLDTGELERIVRDVDKSSISIATGNSEYAAYLVWVADGGVVTPDPNYTLANVRSGKQEMVRAKSSSIILAKWPGWLQNNILAGMDSAGTCWTDIATVRAESNTAETAIATMTKAQVLAYDVDTGPGWTNIGTLTHD